MKKPKLTNVYNEKKIKVDGVFKDFIECSLTAVFLLKRRKFYDSNRKKTVKEFTANSEGLLLRRIL